MSSPQPVTNTKNGFAVGLSTMSGLASVAALIIASTLLAQNRVSPNANYAADSLQTVAYNEVARDSACSASTCSRTATGGVTTYDTLLLVPPNNSTIAAARGVNTATGSLKYLQLDIIRNPANVSIDCTVVGAAKTATGGTALIANASGTGTVAIYIPTSAITVGPTQDIKCGTTGTPTSTFSAVLKGEFSESEIVN